ncbi:hypothetical protein LJ754_16590 [Arthrobacter sp. zg-Y40]|uniref:hypothetical protein n=1 Tax=Arthrobacter sp. zg-Y40 TaxID=2886939 RepID=UPI001D139261|nr:hypothetical protein [Arthrobacter sp. zg-Y40]MCC3280763.1 hypothetical protein [Arthrobacter sp. zg-Y40]
MTITYTSSDLVKIQDSVGERAAAAGLPILAGVNVLRETDVEVDAEEVDIDTALNLAALVGAPFISVAVTPFSLDMTRIYFESEHGEELPPAAEGVLETNASRDGTLMSLTVYWLASGLAYEWSAMCDWAGELMGKVTAVLEDVDATSEIEREERLREHYSNIQAAVTSLIGSRKYFGEQVNKRRHVAPTIIAEAGLDEIDEVTLSYRVIPSANKIVNDKAYEFEEDFRAHKNELALELAEYPDWCRATTKAQKKLVTIDFLTNKAGGYRLMNSKFAEELSDAALYRWD